MATSTTPAGRGGLGSVLAFLSIIPVQWGRLQAPAGAADGADAPAKAASGLYHTAQSMHLFPLAGILLGLGTGLLAWGLFEIVGERLLAGLLAAAAILVVAGLHHTDGLADLADGLMARGSRGRRLAAMRDKSTGTAGTAAVVLCIAGLVIALSMSGGGPGVLIGVVLAEMLAKFSMVVMAAAGKPADGRGTGAVFVAAMKSRGRVAAAAATIIMAYIALAAIAGADAAFAFVQFPLESALAMTAVAVLVPLVLVAVASRAFGGVTGDVFGASNDLVRVASLVVFFSI